MDALPKGNPEIVEEAKPDFHIEQKTEEWLINLWDRCEKLHDSDWLNDKRQMLRARNYFDGRQYGDVNSQLQWVDYPKRTGEITYTANTYQAHIQTALMEMSKGRTELSFSHVSGDSRKGSLVAKIAESRYKAHKRRLFDTIKEQQENLSLLLNGVAIRYTFVKDCSYEKNPSFGQKKMEGDSAMVCAECGAPSKGECKVCGSTEIAEASSPEMDFGAIMGYQDIPQKESDWVSVDPLGCLWYRHAITVKETPYFIWKQAVLKEVIQSKYPDISIKEGITSPELQFQQNSDSSTPGLQLMGGDAEGGKCEIALGWFDLDLYKHYVPKHDLKLRNGVLAPAGVPLGKSLPNGMLLMRNGKRILDCVGENKNDKITIAPYVTRPGTMLGSGTSVALEDQDTKNDLRNLHMQSIWNDSFRREFIDAQYLDPEQIPSDPTERAVLHNSHPTGKIVGGAIDVLPPSPLSPDAYALEERIDGQMQMNMGTFSGTQTGMPDMKAVQDTAAGMQMWREMTIGRFFPMLSVRADRLDREQAFQLLENDQKYLSAKQWEKFKGDYGDEALDLFLKCDLREELVIEVVPESFMPISTSQKQAGLLGWSRFIMETQSPPDSEVSAYAANLFNIPKQIVGHDATVSQAMISVDMFKEQADAVVDEFGDLDSYLLEDPTVMALAQLVLDQAHVPISYKMDNLTVLSDAYRDWWVSDEGRNATNLLKATVLLRMTEIDGAAIQKMQEEQQLQMAAMQPTMEAQAAQAQMQAQAEGAGAEAQMEAEQQKADIEAEKQAADTEVRATEKLIDIEQADKDKDFQREEREAQFEENERQRAHEKEMAKLTKPAPGKSKK